MDNDKELEYEGRSEGETNDPPSGTAPRARNRTVMLTPEVTGEVRARLARDAQEHGGRMSSEAAPRPAPEAGGRRGHAALDAPSSSAFHGALYSPGGRGHALPAGDSERMTVQPTQPGVALSPAAMAAGRSPVYAPASNAVAVQAAARGDRVVWHREARLIGFLVSFDRQPLGEYFELRSGRLIITSEAASTGNFLVLSDETVSPMHAILRMDERGRIQVLDQLSEHGTFIIRRESGAEETLSGDKSEVVHGDVLKFGKRKFSVCLIEKSVEE